jgi:hypothetical protein
MPPARNRYHIPAPSRSFGALPPSPLLGRRRRQVRRLGRGGGGQRGGHGRRVLQRKLGRARGPAAGGRATKVVGWGGAWAGPAQGASSAQLPLPAAQAGSGQLLQAGSARLRAHGQPAGSPWSPPSVRQARRRGRRAHPPGQAGRRLARRPRGGGPLCRRGVVVGVGHVREGSGAPRVLPAHAHLGRLDPCGDLAAHPLQRLARLGPAGRGAASAAAGREGGERRERRAGFRCRAAGCRRWRRLRSSSAAGACRCLAGRRGRAPMRAGPGGRSGGGGTHQPAATPMDTLLTTADILSLSITLSTVEDTRPTAAAAVWRVAVSTPVLASNLSSCEVESGRAGMTGGGGGADGRRGRPRRAPAPQHGLQPGRWALGGGRMAPPPVAAPAAGDRCSSPQPAAAPAPAAGGSPWPARRWLPSPARPPPCWRSRPAPRRRSCRRWPSAEGRGGKGGARRAGHIARSWLHRMQLLRRARAPPAAGARQQHSGTECSQLPARSLRRWPGSRGGGGTASRPTHPPLPPEVGPHPGATPAPGPQAHYSAVQPAAQPPFGARRPGEGGRPAAATPKQHAAATTRRHPAARAHLVARPDPRQLQAQAVGEVLWDLRDLADAVGAQVGVQPVLEAVQRL